MMASFEDALSEREDGLLLQVEVKTESPDNSFPSGYNAWRNVITLRVSAPRVEGRANGAVIDLIAGEMGLPHAAIRIVSGHTSRRKVILISGLNKREAVDILTHFFNILSVD